MKYAVIDIGCLECGNDSDLVAVTDREGAEALGAKIRSEMGEWDWNGAGVLVAFELPEES